MKLLLANGVTLAVEPSYEKGITLMVGGPGELKADNTFLVRLTSSEATQIRVALQRWEAK